MNLYPYFPKEIHQDLFGAIIPSKPLVVSGVGNISAKSYFIGDYVGHAKHNNIFWLVNDNKDIYEVKNNISFWGDRPIISLDNLPSSEDKKDDYRITETVIGLADKTSRIYLLNYKDARFLIPTHTDLVENGVVITDGQEIHIVEFFNQLIKMGYQPSTDTLLNKGEYRRSGGILNIFPPNYDQPIKIEVDYEKVAGIWYYDQETKQLGETPKKVDFLQIGRAHV